MLHSSVSSHFGSHFTHMKKQRYPWLSSVRPLFIQNLIGKPRKKPKFPVGCGGMQCLLVSPWSSLFPCSEKRAVRSHVRSCSQIHEAGPLGRCKECSQPWDPSEEVSPDHAGPLLSFHVLTQWRGRTLMQWV